VIVLLLTLAQLLWGMALAGTVGLALWLCLT